MNLRQLQYFKTIAELEHYTQAAEKLYVSQSNLSHSIKELEDELGVALFARSGRNVKLTKYGELFLPFVTRSLDALNAGVHTLEDYVNPDTGSIILSGFPSLSEFIPEVIVRYLSETNRVGVHLQFNQSADYTSLKAQLLAGEIDLAFSTEMDEPDIAGVAIGEHPVVLIASESDPLSAEDVVDLRELDEHPFVAFDQNCELRGVSDRLFDELGIKPVITLETAQDVLVYGMVAAGQGAAIVPMPVGGVPYNVRILKIANEIPSRKLYLNWNKSRYMPPAAAYLRDFIISKGDIFNQFLERRQNILHA